MLGKKTGGRAPGTPNKITAELREVLKGVVAKELTTITATLEALPPRERLEVLVKLLPYCMPRIGAIEGSYDTDWWDVS